jgi:hypothetical protein
MMQVIYISGPLSNCIPKGYDQFHGRWQNELDASRIAQECIEKGWAVICPHKNTSGFYHIPYEKLIQTDLELVKRCDAILMFGKWQLSPGALREIELAQELGMDIFLYDIHGVPDATRAAGQGEHVIFDVDYLHDGGPFKDRAKLVRIGHTPEDGYSFKISLTDATDAARLPAALIYAYHLSMTGE